MSFGLTRLDLRANAKAKLDDARLLLLHKRFSNAYYLSGYAVELGLKACIARHLTAETIPVKEILKGVLDHDFRRLVALAGLTATLETERKNVDFAANWAAVSEWSPDARYESNDPMSAQTLIQAIIDPKSGVFPWIKVHW
jgi:HEPN domain-containing protein